MKFALASLFVFAAVPAFAGPSLKCSINGEALVGILHEDNTATVSSSAGTLAATVTAVRSGGYKGSPVTDTITITIKDEEGPLETVSSTSALSLKNDAFSIQCAVSNY